MSTKLNLVDRLLHQGRTYQQLHRDRDAVVTLARLARRPDLPADVAEETHVRLAELRTRNRQPHLARRHLRRAVRLAPGNARYHFLLATAYAAKKQTDLIRAGRHYRLALRLDGKQPECLAAYGLYLMKRDKIAAGLEHLRQAADLAPEDGNITAQLVRGLCKAKLHSEARSVLSAARFRNPRDSRLRKLHSDFMFRQLHRTQRQAPRLAPMTGGRAAVLPFVSAAHAAEQHDGAQRLLRLDAASATPAPHNLPRPVRRQDWKHG